MTMTVEGQGDSGSSEGESGVDIPTKRARGRPKVSKKLQALVTQVDPSEFGSGISNDGPTQPLRSRGRAKGSVRKHSPPRSRGRPKGSGWKKLAGPKESPRAGQSTRKRGRPKGSPNKKTLRKLAHKADDWDFTISGSIQPKKGRGRPKGTVSLKRKAESSQSEEDEAGDSSSPRKRGRPKGSPNKKPWLAERRVSSGAESGSDSSSDGQSPAQRGRGTPRKSPVKGRVVAEQTAEDSSKTHPLLTHAKRGPGRPKGSPNKTYPLVHRPDEMVRTRKPSLPFIHPEQLGPKPKGRGRPKKDLHKRGRPRKNPLPPAGDLIRPNVPVPNDGRRRSRGRPKGSLNKSRAANQARVLDEVPAAHHEAGDAEQEGEEEAEEEEGGARENPAEEM